MKKIFRNESGQSVVEYALIVMLIAMTAFICIRAVQRNTEGVVRLGAERLTLYNNDNDVEQKTVAKYIPAIPQELSLYEEHSVTITPASHGTAEASTYSTYPGAPVKLNVYPEAGYRLKGWNVSKGGVTVDYYRFIMGSSDVVLQPIFEVKPE